MGYPLPPPADSPKQGRETTQEAHNKLGSHLPRVRAAGQSPGAFEHGWQSGDPPNQAQKARKSPPLGKTSQRQDGKTARQQSLDLAANSRRAG